MVQGDKENSFTYKKGNAEEDVRKEKSRELKEWPEAVAVIGNGGSIREPQSLRWQT